MKILTRMCMSADGYVTTPEGWPAQLADPDFSPEAYGFIEFQNSIDAVLMGRSTFEPALGAERWPWPDLGVFVLGSHRPKGTPEEVVVSGDPAELLAQMRSAHRDGTVHLVGGPSTIEAFRDLGALDQLGLIVMPFLLGGGMQLTPAVSTDIGLAIGGQSQMPNGAIEIVYDVSASG
jgi:dihydrofolate reductase